MRIWAVAIPWGFWYHTAGNKARVHKVLWGVVIRESTDTDHIRRLAITGSSGYLGGRLVEHVRRRSPATRILGLDLREPGPAAPDEFVRVDILDENLHEAVRAFAPDTIVHGAFVFQPMRDARRMRRMNVEGAGNVLRIAAAVQPQRLLLVSSATAYGAWPDNPVPMNESQPLRARPELQYAADKTEIEQLLAAFAEQHPQIAVSTVRPAIIGGPNMDNYLTRFIFGMPFIGLLDGRDPPMQLVHEDDVVAAIYEILSHDGRGPYNVGPPDHLSLSELARRTNRRAWRLPFSLAYAAAWLIWKTRLPIQEWPPGLLYFVREPWVVAPARLQRELGFRFRYGSLDTLQQIVEGIARRSRNHDGGPP